MVDEWVDVQVDVVGIVAVAVEKVNPAEEYGVDAAEG